MKPACFSAGWFHLINIPKEIGMITLSFTSDHEVFFEDTSLVNHLKQPKKAAWYNRSVRRKNLIILSDDLSSIKLTIGGKV